MRGSGDARLGLALAVIAMGCSSSEEPPSVFATPPPEIFDTGVARVCGIVPGSGCAREGEITRCLCGSFEAQVGRFVCCRGGVAVDLGCQQAQTARDCDGNLASRADSGTTD